MAKKKRGLGCLFTLVVFVLIIWGASGIFQRLITGNESFPGFMQRSVTANDLTVTDEYSFPISMKLKIVPRCDISGLEFLIEFFDYNGNMVKRQYHYVGDVKRGNTYYSELNLNFLESFSIARYRYRVSKGTTSLI